MAVDDWAVGEFAARCAPMEPSQDLGPGQVVSACFRGLQFVDIPTKNAGLERCHAFMTLGRPGGGHRGWSPGREPWRRRIHRTRPALASSQAILRSVADRHR